MLAIAWQYLTGRSIATDPADRSSPEWPPHPDRVFQALVAAWGEAGCSPGGAQALAWIASLGPPQVGCPLDVPIGAAPKVFVPVNDVAAIAENRPRKPRRFPSVLVGDAVCSLVWPDAEPGEHLPLLSDICAAVSHVGHSSSVVRMWVASEYTKPCLQPASESNEYRLRVPTPGRLDELTKAFSGGGIGWRRPPIASWCAYERILDEGEMPGGDFDPRILVARFASRSSLSLLDAPAVVLAMRGMLIAAANHSQAARRLISGHEADGTPLGEAHVALLPLGFVGDGANVAGIRADGHLMGVGVALPRNLAVDSEQEILLAVAGALRAGAQGAPRLLLGARGAVDLAFDAPVAPPKTLDPMTWCRPARIWASVTPIALDRSAPRRHSDLDAWATDQIRTSCLRQGLPGPDVELLPVSRFSGAPTAADFPRLMRKDGSRRWHIHACLRFHTAISGPLVLGAGRYRGYGLFRPVAHA
jgi:CRISPR-associated protein Csb2